MAQQPEVQEMNDCSYRWKADTYGGIAWALGIVLLLVCILWSVGHNDPLCKAVGGSTAVSYFNILDDVKWEYIGCEMYVYNMTPTDKYHNEYGYHNQKIFYVNRYNASDNSLWGDGPCREMKNEE
jgi:hypothetical protein